MKTRYLVAAGIVLLAVVGVTIAQQHTRPVTVPQPPTLRPERAPTPSQAQDPLVVATPRRQPNEAKPEDLTIDQLIEAVDEFREQKAELEKREKAYLKVLRRKAEKQKERIDGLGGSEPNLPPALIPGPVVPGASYSPLPASGASVLPPSSN